MNDRSAQERMAQLQARAQAQRLAAQLAMLEVGEQLAPLRSAFNLIRAATGAFSPGRPTAGLVATLAKFGIGHPWLTSAAAAAALRAGRHHPLALAVAAVIGAATWWLISAPARGEEEGPGQ